tara:strand:- start:1465 stop:2208 length:744 start_codon:yes stop_codon:yes gene_type:complete
MYKEYKGIILKSIPFSESSIISRIYTPNLGKISTMAHGAKKNKKAIILEPMNIIEFQINYKESKSLQILKEVSINKGFLEIRKNLSKIAFGLTMLEILDKTTRQLDPSPILYRLIYSSLYELSASYVNNLVLFNFYLIQFSKYSGFDPLSNHCHSCNSFILTAFYNIKNGMLCCEKCKNVDFLKVNKKDYSFLKQISNIHIKQLCNIENTNMMNFKINKYLIEFMKFHLQGMNAVKSLSFLNNFIAK